MSVWMQVALVAAMVLATVVVIVLFQRGLEKPGARDSWGVTGGDAFGGLTEIFNPGAQRSKENLKEHEAKREIAPAPTPDLDRAVTVRRNADGSLTLGSAAPATQPER